MCAKSVLRSDCRIVETGGDGVRGADLAVTVLQDIGAGAVEHVRGGGVA